MSNARSSANRAAPDSPSATQASTRNEVAWLNGSAWTSHGQGDPVRVGERVGPPGWSAIRT